MYTKWGNATITRLFYQMIDYEKIHRFITNVVFIGGNCTTSYEGEFTNEPSVAWNRGSRLFNLGFWGGTNTQGTYKEFNNHISFQYKGFSLALWDTYNFSTGATYNNKEFFNYKAHSTGRFLDAILNYYCGERFPLLISWSTIVFGRDRNKENTANKYSTFCYLEYPIYTKSRWHADAGIGGAFALNKAGSKTNFYGNTNGIVHVLLKVTFDWTLAKHTMPIHACMVWNPQADRAFFQLGIQLFNL